MIGGQIMLWGHTIDAVQQLENTQYWFLYSILPNILLESFVIVTVNREVTTTTTTASSKDPCEDYKFDSTGKLKKIYHLYKSKLRIIAPYFDKYFKIRFCITLFLVRTRIRNHGVLQVCEVNLKKNPKNHD